MKPKKYGETSGGERIKSEPVIISHCWSMSSKVL